MERESSEEYMRDKTIPLSHEHPQGDIRSNFRGRVLTVFVGPEREPFHIHPAILSSSAYFSNALKGSWKESRGEMDMEHVLPEVFELYTNWLYTKGFSVNHLVPEAAFDTLHNAYVLGDYVQDVSFRNYVIRAIIGIAARNNFFPHNLAKQVYDQTPPSSPWRLLYIDLWLCDMENNGGKTQKNWPDMENGPKEFFVDLLERKSACIFKKDKAESGMQYVKRKCGRGNSRRVEPEVPAYRLWWERESYLE